VGEVLDDRSELWHAGQCSRQIPRALKSFQLPERKVFFAAVPVFSAIEMAPLLGTRPALPSSKADWAISVVVIAAARWAAWWR
jgi:hypothetical protein